MIIDIVLVYAAGRGGLEDVITNVSNSLVQKGHRVRVFQSHKPKNIEWIDTLPELHFYGKKQGLQEETVYSLIEGYRDLLEKIDKPDVVLATHAPSLSFICRAALAGIKGKMPPIISWLHGPPEYYGNQHLLKYSDAHLAISTQIGKSIQKSIQPDIPVYYVGNPVILKDTKRVNRSYDQLKLIYIGRLHHDKRIDILLKGLVNLNEDWELVFIGEGPEEEGLKNLSKELGIDNNIEWLGWKENPWDYITDASVFVLTSYNEGFGLVLVEALSRGIPVISSDSGGPLDIVEEGVNGWLFPTGDFNSLNRLLEDVASGKKVLPSQKTCEQSITKFDLKNVIDNIELIINYQYAFEQSNEKEVDISSYIVKENSYLSSNISGTVIEKTIQGIQSINAFKQKSQSVKLNEYFTSSFLTERQTDFIESEWEYSICYPKLKFINYKFSKAIVDFIFIQKSLDSKKIVSEKLNCEAKLINEDGKWKADELLFKSEVPQPKRSVTTLTGKKKILLVTTNNSGSNTFALYKNTPDAVKEKYDVELVKQELTDTYFKKVEEADILVITEGNILQNKKNYNPEQIIIDLWHGFPIKAMGYADKNEINKNSIADRWLNTDYVCSYSPAFNHLIDTCFKVDEAVFKITGAPRNDLLMESASQGDRTILSWLFNINAERSNVLFYMPTYRQVSYSDRLDTNLNRDNVFGFDIYNSVEFNHFLKENDLHLIVKLHPAEESLFINKIEENEHIHLLTNEMLSKQGIDLYEVLGISDLLITDYSSVYFDYLLIDKPTIFTPLDIEEYELKRGFLIDSYSNWMAGPKIKNQDQLQQSIIKSLENKEEYSKERKNVKDKVHFYQDAVSARRVWDFIRELL